MRSIKANYSSIAGMLVCDGVVARSHADRGRQLLFLERCTYCQEL